MPESVDGRVAGCWEGGRYRVRRTEACWVETESRGTLQRFACRVVRCRDRTVIYVETDF